MLRFIITVYNQGFKVHLNYGSDMPIMSKFCITMKSYEQRYNHKLNKKQWLEKTDYTTFNTKTMTYGIHKSLLTDFLNHLQLYRVNSTEIQVTIIEGKLGVKSYVKLQEGVKLRPYQEPIIEFLLSDKKVMILPLQMGKGKTLCSLYTIAKLGVRTAICIDSMHVDTWLKDSHWIYENAEEEIMVIRGKQSFINVIEQAKAKTLNKTILIFTIKTIRDYINEYLELHDTTYGCLPIELFDCLGVGLRINDEAHMNLHFQFKMEIETSVDKVIFLSATLESNNAFTNKLYGLIFPTTHRYLDDIWTKYTVVYGIGYQLQHSKHVRCTGSMGYDHKRYEGWILENKIRKDNYFLMVKDIILKTFHKEYQKGQVLLVYMSRVEMCYAFSEYLKKDVNLRLYKISDFTQDHDDIVLHSNDIVISTIGKAGVGKNIKGLTKIISTVSIAAKESNIQMMGRLRPINDLYPGVDPVFYYLVCMNIPKHVEYHTQKIELFKPLVKSVSGFKSNYVV